ncbi:MAG: hypothetical protein QOI64_1550 [Solirubrobacteraceae bacterium]|jgi:hypothetical protein|nr:hypothetical protein [Solirubrobacteraceae bacterium]
MRRGSWTAAAAALALALTAGGCGGDDEFANRERAPAPITLSAAITPRDITVSPSRIGAGAVELIVSNLTSVSQQITLRSEMLSAGTAPLEQRTGPINPGDTASLTADLVQGAYRITSGTSRTPSATIRVGPSRSSATDQLLQP